MRISVSISMGRMLSVGSSVTGAPRAVKPLGIVYRFGRYRHENGSAAAGSGTGGDSTRNALNSQWRRETVVSSPGARDERSASVDEEMERLSARHLDVFIDIAPGTIDGNFGSVIYRGKAGPISNFASKAGCTAGTSDNTQYQKFIIQAQNGSIWEDFPFIIAAHVDNLSYPVNGTIIAGPTSSRSTVIVATVDSTTCSWPAHLHWKGYSNTGWARTYNWDGPSAQNEYGNWGPACLRSGGNPANCETQIFSTDVVGYVGGNKPNFAEVNNPYLPDF